MRRLLMVLLGVCLAVPAAQAEWFKGVTHVHSLWSDGDTAPEVIAAWYKERGYDFVTFSDHNVQQVGDKYIEIAPESKLTPAEVESIRGKFGTNWVQVREENGRQQMRLKTHEELTAYFNEAGKFLLFPAEEITSLKKGAHVNALNLRDLIPGEPGENVDNTQLMQSYLDQVAAQRKKYGVPMIAHINHVNFSDGVTTEQLLRLHGLEFFEVYNGHPSVYNWGRPERGMPATDRHWDVVQAFNQKKDPNYILRAVATDDSHDYKKWGVGESNPGRGWVMVDAAALEPNALVEALQEGKFYATCGVSLQNIGHDGKSLRFEIIPEDGVTYRTQFIGTLQGFNEASEAVLDAGGAPIRYASRKYSDEIGRVLAESSELAPHYEFKGNELYVRAKVISSKVQENPFAEGDLETAWVQPVLAN